MTTRGALVRLLASLTLAAAVACNSPVQSPAGPSAGAGAEPSAPAPSAPAPAPDAVVKGNCTIGFDGLGPHGASFSGYGDCGLKVSTTVGNWQIWTMYGWPAPSVVFTTPPGITEEGEITVSSSDGPFTFTSADLYSSITKIPWVFTGQLGGATVFTASNTQPNTFGAFATIANPHAAVSIDVLRIRLVNPVPPCCSNPMGLDNIRVVR